jgi:hypothetical protein
MAAGMERLAATMVFCEAPFDGTMAPAVPAGDDKSRPADGVTAAQAASALLEAAKGYFSFGAAQPPVEQHSRDSDSVALFFEVTALE